ncbi:MAG: hypothetical protein A2287_09995 [Candidatus Melainabacteria bacterium RIFOXYA12_FULL_32_12]|nr:MAG: hypothetical protein A2104_05420 [Candidatus Melainabacteria bacterium GWF2_32_7]OGI21127.1 MAG: hypothetical protein A2255_00875 [Candidatus Melainabacteria bacterium RIFOXYA2_FULL_32_9]OGI31115.1 MAG: hypothetical protein A2287_09995 [Candidatus Melainabacteria bacterium RIFOXYA12_FULL_32_12]
MLLNQCNIYSKIEDRSMNQTPICPIMSSKTDVPQICAEENCAWYMKNYKTCAVYILAHNAALDIKNKQGT